MLSPHNISQNFFFNCALILKKQIGLLREWLTKISLQAKWAQVNGIFGGHVFSVCNIRSISRANCRFKVNFLQKSHWIIKLKPMKQTLKHAVIQALNRCTKRFLQIFYSAHLCVCFILGQKVKSPSFGEPGAHKGEKHFLKRCSSGRQAVRVASKMSTLWYIH